MLLIVYFDLTLPLIAALVAVPIYCRYRAWSWPTSLRAGVEVFAAGMLLKLLIMVCMYQMGMSFK